MYDGRTAGSRNQDGQRERCDHENDRGSGSGFAQDRAGPPCAERGLGAAATESSGPVRSFSLLQKHNENQENANDNVENRQQSDHIFLLLRPSLRLRPIALTLRAGLTFAAAHVYLMMAANETASKLAPPTSAPSISSYFIRAEMFSGLTLPPYKMRSASAAAAL
jgi:hypothetical protein